MMGRIAICCLAVLLFGCAQLSVSAQEKHVIGQRLVWFAYYNTLKFNDRWSLGADVQERRFVDPAAQHLFAARAHLIRALGNDWDARAGGSVFLNGRSDPGSSNDRVIPELRPHIEFTHRQKLRWLQVHHRYRAEGRFYHHTADGELGGGYAFGNFRFRYLLGIDIPLRKSSKPMPERWMLRLNDEILINAGAHVIANTFDQNRIYAGIAFWVKPTLGFELGYLNAFQSLSGGTEFYQRHILRLAITQRLDLSERTAAPPTQDPR
ncbi:MAG TPA: DUF2490 domain-containing protein [Flavobacteriales bacterium]|nr:DUF2490 domain-containing protein [Flavobacteriales bacterium]